MISDYHNANRRKMSDKFIFLFIIDLGHFHNHLRI